MSVDEQVRCQQRWRQDLHLASVAIELAHGIKLSAKQLLRDVRFFFLNLCLKNMRMKYKRKMSK
jgi:hypothetical protein